MLNYFINYFINLDFKLTYPITNILECISIVFMFMPFERSWKYVRNCLIDIFVVIFAYLLLGSFYYMLFGDAGHKFFMIVVYSVIIVLYAVFRSNLKPAVRVINGFFLLSTFILLVEISGAAGFTVLSIFGRDIIIINIIINAFFLMVDVLLVNILSFNNEKNVSPLSAAVVIFITIVVFIMQSLGITMSVSQVFRLIIFISFWIIDLLTYGMSYYLTRMQNVNLALLAESHQRENIENLMNVSEQNIRKIREFRHDEKNKFLTLRMLLEKGQLEETKKFFDGMEIDLQSLDAGKKFIDSGNNVLNAIVNIEDSKASANGVKLETNLLVPPELSIDGNDLCGLLMNMIDNAIEATIASGNKNVPVKADIKQINGSLFIRISNAVGENCEKEKILSLQTTKNEKLHGYGTKIINKIVQKYNGIIEYKIENDSFIVDVMI